MASDKHAARALDDRVPAKVRDVLCEQLGLDEPEVTIEARLVEQLGADSLDLVEIAMALEDAYKLETQLEDRGADAWNQGTVGDVLETLRKAGVAV